MINLNEDGDVIVKQIQFSISNEVLSAARLDINEIQEYLSELASIFKDDYISVFPTEIKDNPTLSSLIILSKNLGKLKKCEGFDKHITNFKTDRFHSIFMTILSGFLVSKVNKLILESPIKNKTKQSDIFINFNNEQIFIECKSINTKQFEYLDEHNKIFEILKEYIDFPHQIDLTYRNPLSQEEINKIGETLQEKLPRVTNDGKIINNEDLEVGVQIREKYGNKNLKLLLTIHSGHIHENCIYPGHVYAEDGKSISIVGPKVDYSKILIKKIKDSKNQHDPEKPYILAIDANNLLGDYSENLRKLATSFQPNINTRFSGILLVRYLNYIHKFDLEFDFITNPYSKHPTSGKFKALFQNQSASSR
jgi:hypothetical protein